MPAAPGTRTELSRPDTWASGDGMRATSAAVRPWARTMRPGLVGQAPVGVEHGLGLAGRARGEQDHGDVGAPGRPVVSGGADSRASNRGRRCAPRWRPPARPAAGRARPGPPPARGRRACRATSAGPTWWWMGAATAPHRQQARKSTSASHQLGSCQVTTSPAPDAQPAAGRRPPRTPVRSRVPASSRTSPSTTATPGGRPGRAEERVEGRHVPGPPGRRYRAAPGWR